MPKYFSIPQIRRSVEHLSEFDSKWVIPPLVFASNLVTTGPAFRDLNLGGSPDRFLANFFSGALIGLKLRDSAGSLRPKFRELQTTGLVLDAVTHLPIPDADYLLHQKVKLWGSGYSRNGYDAMINRGELEKQLGTLNSFRLTAPFQPAFEAALPGAFRFEYLLIWLNAFKPLPDDVNSWQELWDHFKVTYLGGNEFPQEYRGRFSVRAPLLAWPTDFLTVQPTDLEYQRNLIPSSVTESLGLDFWRRILADLEASIAVEYEGYSAEECERLARSIASGLAGTKRVFLLGDPGTGKSKLAQLIKRAFQRDLDDGRFFSLESEVTDKTTESTMVGFTGLDGGWIPGTLTTLIDGKALLNTSEQLTDITIRNQVNLLILDEANRKDIEVLLARFQTALDSLAQEPRDDCYKIALGRDGVRWISPFTFIIMTGNSPKDDEGRVEQSRPFKRRPALIRVSNPLSRELATIDEIGFLAKVLSIWNRAASESQASGMAPAIVTGLQSDPDALRTLHAAFVCMNTFGLGVSYGLLKKLLILIGNEHALGATTIRDSIDGALCNGVSALTGVRTTISGRSLKSSILQVESLQLVFPRFYEFISESLSDTSEYGTVISHF